MAKTNPYNNQSEQGSPTASDYGQAFRAGIPSTLNAIQPALAPTHLFQGFVGPARARAGRTIAITTPGGYTGEFPLNQQPQIQKPLPYKKGG